MHLGVLVRSIEPGSMVGVGTACQSHFVEQFHNGVCLPQGINQKRLLPIGQELLIGAQVFLGFHSPSSRGLVRAAIVGCRVAGLRVGAPAPPVPGLAVDHIGASWMLEPHGRVAGSSSCTNVGLHTPSSWATACALSCRVHNAMTAACFIAGSLAIPLDRPTTRMCSSACDSWIQERSESRAGYQARHTYASALLTEGTNSW